MQALLFIAKFFADGQESTDANENQNGNSQGNQERRNMLPCVWVRRCQHAESARRSNKQVIETYKATQDFFVIGFHRGSPGSILAH